MRIGFTDDEDNSEASYASPWGEVSFWHSLGLTRYVQLPTCPLGNHTMFALRPLELSYNNNILCEDDKHVDDRMILPFCLLSVSQTIFVSRMPDLHQMHALRCSPTNEGHQSMFTLADFELLCR